MNDPTSHLLVTLLFSTSRMVSCSLDTEVNVNSQYTNKDPDLKSKNFMDPSEFKQKNLFLQLKKG